MSLPNNGKKTSVEKECEKALNMIRKSEKPLIISGGGVMLGRAWDELRTFVKALNIPITSTLMGLGAFPATDPHWLGMPGMHGTYYANMAISNCDLMIALGMRFDDRVTSKLDAFAPHAKVIHIDIDPASIDKFVKTHLSIASDCKPVLQLLNKWIADDKFVIPEAQTKAWLDQIAAWKKHAPMTYCQGDKIKPQHVVDTLYRLTKGKAIITTEVGQNQMWAAQFYHFDYPNSFISSGGLGTMGFGFPGSNRCTGCLS